MSLLSIVPEMKVLPDTCIPFFGRAFLLYFTPKVSCLYATYTLSTQL